MVKSSITKSNKKKDADYLIVTLEDLYGTYEMTLFNDNMNKYQDLIIPKNKVFILGSQSTYQANSEDKTLKINPLQIFHIDDVKKLKGDLIINLDEDDATIEFANYLLENCQGKKSNLNLVLKIKTRDGRKQIIEPEGKKVNPSMDFVFDVIENRKLHIENLLDIEKTEKKENKRWYKNA
jgi:DNA polymerase III alpha subunit